ncbi:MAG: hypothetical protein P4M02_05895 [Clostridia bacterium]|nr:hypothetical protein [Clostridia bacterium]
MMREITMPKTGVNVTEVTVTKWLVSPGDEIKDGQAIVEIESYKATQEVSAQWDGTVEKLLVAEGDEVECNAPIAIVRTNL